MNIKNKIIQMKNIIMKLKVNIIINILKQQIQIIFKSKNKNNF